MINMANSLRERYSQIVNENHIIVDNLLGKNCLGYNIQYVFSKDQLSIFDHLQQQISKPEFPNLYQLPEQSLHISIAWILATRTDYGRQKDLIWQEIKDKCCFELDTISKTFQKFVVTFQDIIATDSAIILVAQDHGEMSELRTKISTQLPIPQMTNNKAEIIHATLFKYTSPLNDPKSFLEHISNIHVDLPVTINSMLIRKELVYPSIKSELVFSTQLQ